MNSTWMLDCGPDGTILFGPQTTRYPFSKEPTIGDTDRTVQDAVLDGVDGSLFGVDTTAGQTIAFELHAIGNDDFEAAALWAAFKRAWRADSVRSTRGATATLTAPSGRSIFGRPRRCTPTPYPDGAGAVAITADFATRDDLWYGPEQTHRVEIGTTQGGGFVFDDTTPLEGPVEQPAGSGFYTTTGLPESPSSSGFYAPDGLEEYPYGSGLYGTTRAVRRRGLKFPLVARGYSTQANTFVVDGELNAWPVFTIHGQILNPSVRIDDTFTVTYPGSLNYDETLTIDTRPGRRSVLRNGTQIAALSRSSSLLSSASLTPGAHTLTLTGSSSSGSPDAVVTWRSVYPTP